MTKKKYIVTRSSNDNTISHSGKKGMKWGYSDGEKNGKRTAGDVISDWAGVDESIELAKAKGRETAKEEKRDAAKEVYENASAKDKAAAYEQYRKADTDYVKSEIERAKAQINYDSTLMGMVDNMESEIRSGADYIKKLLKIH